MSLSEELSDESGSGSDARPSSPRAAPVGKDNIGSVSCSEAEVYNVKVSICNGHQFYAQIWKKIRSKLNARENARARLHPNKENFELKKPDLCTKIKRFNVMSFWHEQSLLRQLGCGPIRNTILRYNLLNLHCAIIKTSNFQSSQKCCGHQGPV